MATPRLPGAATPRMRTLLPLLLTAAALVTAILAGHEGTRMWQVLVLALPAWFWLWWPLGSASRRRVTDSKRNPGIVCARWQGKASPSGLTTMNRRPHPSMQDLG